LIKNEDIIDPNLKSMKDSVPNTISIRGAQSSKKYLFCRNMCDKASL